MTAEESKRGIVFAPDDLGAWGCLLAIITGVGLTGLGIYLQAIGDGPAPLRVALVILGVANVLLGYRALLGSRIGWAFATAICGTLALICLFGAPTFRDTTGYSLGVSALPCFVFAVTTTLLALRSPR